MPKGPQGQKRPADVIGNAVHVMRIATGEEEDKLPETSAAAEMGRRGGLKGGKVRMQKLAKSGRVKLAKKAARARWDKERV